MGMKTDALWDTECGLSAEPLNGSRHRAVWSTEGTWGLGEFFKGSNLSMIKSSTGRKLGEEGFVLSWDLKTYSSSPQGRNSNANGPQLWQQEAACSHLGGAPAGSLLLPFSFSLGLQPMRWCSPHSQLIFLPQFTIWHITQTPPPTPSKVCLTSAKNFLIQSSWYSKLTLTDDK